MYEISYPVCDRSQTGSGYNHRCSCLSDNDDSVFGDIWQPAVLSLYIYTYTYKLFSVSFSFRQAGMYRTVGSPGPVFTVLYTTTATTKRVSCIQIILFTWRRRRRRHGILYLREAASFSLLGGASRRHTWYIHIFVLRASAFKTLPYYGAQRVVDLFLLRLLTLRKRSSRPLCTLTVPWCTCTAGILLLLGTRSSRSPVMPYRRRARLVVGGRTLGKRSAS